MTSTTETPKNPKTKPPFDPIRHRLSQGEISFLPGTLYLFEGRVVELKQLVDDECLVWDAAEGQEISCRPGELDLPKPQTIRGPRRPAHLTGAQFKLAQKLRATMILYCGLPKEDRTNAKLEEYAVAFRLSGRQLRRRFKAWNGRLDSLLPGLRGPSEDSKRLDPRVEALIDECIKKRKACGEEWTLDALVDDIEKACENAKTKLDPPCKRTVANRLARSGHDQQLHRKHGHAKARHKENSHVKTYDPGLPLAQVQIDHTRVDLMVYDSEERVGLKRPWLTLVFDSASRVVLGFHLSFDAPSVESVACALLMAMLPKHQLLKEYGIEGLTWDVWGKPKTIQTDWAKEFRSRSFGTICGNFEIKATLRRFAKKHWGGRIERVIGTFMSACHMLPGTTFSNPKARDSYDSEARALMDLCDVRAWLINQIIEYNNTPHSALKQRTPMQQWKHLLTTKDGDFIPPPLVDPSRYKQFEYDLLPSVKKQVHVDHVNWNNRPYKDGVFTFFQDQKGVDIRYHPNRLRTILFRDRHNVIHEIPTTQPPTRNLTLSEEKAIASAVRLDSLADVDAKNQRQEAKKNKARIQADAEKKTRKAKRGGANPPPPPSIDNEPSEGEFVIPSVVIWN